MVGSAEWGPGHVIADKFRLVRPLGKGGMGSVWAAEHLQLNSAVAVKVIDPSIAMNPDALARFMREAQAAAALRSPHVVQTFDYGVDGGVPFIAMELLEGQSLAERLEQVTKLSVEETALIMTQVGRAISKAHEKGIVHRDLKPDNIFLVRNDDEEIAKVLDFGVAKSTGSTLGTSSQTRTGAILGTPYYMSPEQAEGNRSVDHRTDLWSMGIIAYECVVGRRPFESEALGDLILQICVRPIKKPSSVAVVPPGFDEWFKKATERDLALRFATARELAAELRTVAGFRADTARLAPIAGSGSPRVPGSLAASTGGGRSGPPGNVAAGGVRAVTPVPAAKTGGGTEPRGAEPPAHSPLNATTGGVGAVSHTSQKGGRTSTGVIVGATVGTLALAGGLAFLLLRSSGHADAAAPTSEGASASASTAVTAPPSAATAAQASVATPNMAAPAVLPVADSASAAPETPPAPTPAFSNRPISKTQPPLASKRTDKADKTEKPDKADKPAKSQQAPKQHVDFGF